MKPLMLIPPAQAEALFDALEEQWADRSPALPWQDDDGPDETIFPARAAPAGTGEKAARPPMPHRRAA